MDVSSILQDFLKPSEVRNMLMYFCFYVNRYVLFFYSLYCAVEHQLKNLDGSSAPTLNELRVMTSEFLREHSVDFLPYLSHPDTGEMLTEQQFQEYCDQVANTPAWGGQVEVCYLYRVI